MAHRNHPDCPYPTKTACDAAARSALGPCSAFVGEREPHPCGKWAVVVLGDQPLCGQHANAAALQVDQAGREARRRAVINARIDRYLAWTADHPSVHDRMPERTT